MGFENVNARASLGAGAAALCLALACVLAGAQTPAANPAPAGSKPAQSATSAAKTKKRMHAAKQPEPQPQPVVAAPAPPPPDWPVNDKAAPAAVDWNGRMLSVLATNSSLQQILTDISTATGVKVEGSPTDQRIYGSYGPAPARDVLSQLLQGSGYNVLMVGDQGQGTPRTLVLTAKGSAPAVAPGAAVQAHAAEEDAEEPEQPEQPDPNLRRPPGLQPLQPGQNRTPQQIMQDIEQRRLQMQQQQGAPVAPQPTPQPQPNNQ